MCLQKVFGCYNILINVNHLFKSYDFGISLCLVVVEEGRKTEVQFLFTYFQEWKEHEIWYIYRPKGTVEDKQIEREITISGLLQYIVEGIVPLLSTFCVEYQKCIESFDDELSVQPLKPEHITILNDIGSAVAVRMSL